MLRLTKDGPFNTSMPGDEYMRIWTGWTLILVNDMSLVQRQAIFWTNVFFYPDHSE